MAVLLSPVGGAAAQFLDNNGNPLLAGKLYTYVAGTTTNQATYTSSSGATPHPNPIILDAGGRVPGGEIWLTDGLQYKFVLKNSSDVLIGTYDNLVGINSNFVNFLTKTEVQTATAGQTVFTLTTMQYQPGTNNLTVYVDGVNQIDGATYSYVETSSTVVTFTAGLHVGALVKFTTAQTLSTGVTDASLVTYDPPFTGSVGTTVEDKLAQTVSVKDFGAVGDGVADDTAAFAAAIESGYSLYVPEGTYVVSTLTSSRTGTISMAGAAPVARALGASVIQFTDNGTGTGIGMNLSSFNLLFLANLQFKTAGTVDGRTSGGNFIGIDSHSATGSRTWKVTSCLFSGFSKSGIYSESLIGSAFIDVSFSRCNYGIQLAAGYFPVSGTTTQFIRGYSAQCNTVHRITSLSESLWDGCIFEYSGYGVEGSSNILCTVRNCYAEANTSYGGFFDNTRAVLFENNYSNSAGDSWTSAGSTGAYGFDAIGSTYVQNNLVKTRQVQFYDRNGAESEIIKASDTAYSGQLVVTDASDVVLGSVLKTSGLQNSGMANRSDMFMVNGATVYGAPTGWTITNSGTGIWDITWPATLTGDTRWPFIFAQGVPSQSNAVSGGQIDVIATVRARDSSSLWSGFRNMNIGFQIRIYTIEPTTGVMTLSANGAAVQVNW